ncbi:hypothetical protein CPAST_c12270 [Clostridium pasteurianum DSM 525 = ATCC 6013]|uniref:Uncharacterized protein n=1 Tax=Clostridium pasteurianum DSM 525 = ATCC 6013 TaxID=1262449 RepID=A0A0H3J3D2_CLOPA|nr:hypothetical protein [Clostridium pasteurianum]AJA47327.1 hypothetical protein CPAST_c12270 [Clostridium pasteurianum DSM 525 = ATCC 6013]AJA51315.1 hypothetical protein CLPA_c12270 [Clostridium pasteurianum DSM 525 = ATCC 6013]AOZ74663.1 hypothetical protein AQ983_05930 [Clostridium pasteurianum DSM 525 = ATCC 6013]AOZ78460.1 hypothetical protein AQ984_05920 [Clostridium pasteurianum]ELP58664.1 hypothetical protein F502_12813 [Clostridium pasteurianum DSM 525 = ATCC 6013]
MEKLSTKYGIIEGISSLDYYGNGNPRDCIITKTVNELKTSYGILIPQYESGSERRKHVKSLSFYDDGNLQSIYLQNQTKINTPVGTLPAELITFYKSGKIKRIFPLNGQITAYWSEQDEYNLAEDISLDLSVGKIEKKIISINFYENGVVKSVTFWPTNPVEIDSPIGKVMSRIGFAFYNSGKLKSFEPLRPTKIKTPIGEINAYDVDALGIHADLNSVNFFEDGNIKSLTTSSDSVEITTNTGEKKIYKPGLKISVINDEVKDIVPLTINFDNDKVYFNGDINNSYSLKACSFNVKYIPLQVKSPCAGCSSDSSCDGECC